MRILEEESLLDNCSAMGEYLSQVEELKSKHAMIGEVRGKGLFCGAELVADRETRSRWKRALFWADVADCITNSQVIGATNRSDGLNNTLCLSPALICTKSIWMKLSRR